MLDLRVLNHGITPSGVQCDLAANPSLHVVDDREFGAPDKRSGQSGVWFRGDFRDLGLEMLERCLWLGGVAQLTRLL